MKKIVSIILTAIVLICINGTVNASDVVTVPVNNPHPQENFELDMNGSTGYGVIDLVIRNAAGKKIGTAPAGHTFNFGRDCGQALGLWTNWPPDTSCLAIRDNLHPVRIKKYAGSLIRLTTEEV